MIVYIAASEYSEDIHGVATSKGRALDILRDNCPRNGAWDAEHTCPNNHYCVIREFTLDERMARE